MDTLTRLDRATGGRIDEVRVSSAVGIGKRRGSQLAAILEVHGTDRARITTRAR